MNPDVNIPENDPERDREKRPWMYERVFGGRVYKRKSGLFYWYDVVICSIDDALVDCLGDVMRLNKTWGPLCYSEMRRSLWSEEPRFMYYLNQISARFFGCVVISQILGFISRLIERFT